MDEKKCPKCNLIKKVNEFYKRKAQCKTCMNIELKKYRDNNKEKVSLTIKKCRENNKEKYLETERKYRENNRENIIKLRTENKEKYAISKKEYDKKKLLTCPEYKILKNTRRRVSRMLNEKEISKTTSTIELIGCSISQFKKWLESNFDQHMKWDNYGSYWHIDHVMPCSSFEMENAREQRACFSWENCRPLKGKDNVIKNNKIIQLQLLLQEIRVTVFKKNMRQNQIAGTPLAS